MNKETEMAICSGCGGVVGRDCFTTQGENGVVTEKFFYEFMEAVARRIGNARPGTDDLDYMAWACACSTIEEAIKDEIFERQRSISSRILDAAMQRISGGDHG